ncbi:MAG: EAL domain-containing protein [Solirubrobacteraceae bacterium]
MTILSSTRRLSGGIGSSRGGLLTAVLALVVVAAMVAASVVTRDDADAHRQAEVVVEQLQAASQQMSAFKWQSDVEVLTDRSGALARLAPAVAAGEKIFVSLKDEAADLGRLAPGPDATRLQRDVSLLYAAGLQGITSLVAPDGRSGASLKRVQVQFQPVLDRLDADAQRAALQEQTVAARSLRQSLVSSIASMLLGLASLAILGMRLSRVNRKAALADEVRSLERRSEARIRALVEHSSDVVTVLDRNLHVRWQAASVHGLLGLAPGSMVEAAISSITHPDDRELFDSFLRARLDGSGPGTFRMRMRHSDGRWLHVETIAEDRFGDPAIEGLVLNMRDISERVEFEEELRHAAFHDALTGLANRALFENRLRHALASGVRSPRSLAVLFLDLDDFKTINDSLGHAVGDTLLQSVAARIDPLVRPTDTAARLGGDEFAVLLEGVDSEAEAEEIAQRILDSLTAGFHINDRELRVTASIGISLSDETVDADALLRNADMAMYAAKASGKNSLHRFEPTMYRSALERLELRSELPRALENDELRVFYQPIVSLGVGQIVGVEALVRWQHPARGLLGPGQFIGLAEETGLIVPLGRWVLARACRQVREWQLTLPQAERLYVSVNVSIKQLHDKRLPGAVAEILTRTGLPPECLVLEITEGLLADDREAIVTQLRALKHLGLRIAVDDFGTGYSGLSHLQQFPIDILKIDKSFIDELSSNSQRANLVQGIINLGETLELDVVAEGIEDLGQADQLRSMRSKHGQGFFFSRPMTPAASQALLEVTRQLPALPLPDPLAPAFQAPAEPGPPGIAEPGLPGVAEPGSPDAAEAGPPGVAEPGTG